MVIVLVAVLVFFFKLKGLDLSQVFIEWLVFFKGHTVAILVTVLVKVSVLSPSSAKLDLELLT